MKIKLQATVGLAQVGQKEKTSASCTLFSSSPGRPISIEQTNK